MRKGKIKSKVKSLMSGQIQAVGVVEMVLILVVLLGLVVIFRTQLTSIVTNIFSSITNTVDGFL